MATVSNPTNVVDRLMRATNAHDVDAIVACFHPGYENRTPAHPARNFTGHDQVRRNWTQILAGVPDLVATVHASAVHDDDVWTEMEMAGTRRDGSRHAMAGVIIFTIRHDAIVAARFYLEPLDEGPGTVDDTVRSQVSR